MIGVEIKFFFNIYLYILENMQNQVQAQLQEFLNNISHIHTTPPERAQEVLNNIRSFYEQVNDPYTLSVAFFKLADHIMRLKQVNEQIRWLLEQCVFDIITKSVQTEFKIGSQALKLIFDPNFEYFRHNNLDPSLVYPLGSTRKLNWYEPQVGQKVDVVKPYITSTSFCSWTRGILLSKQNKKYTIKYDNTQAPATYKQMPFFAPVGTRTIDYDWRLNLDVGSFVDAYNRVWYSSTVTEVGFENGSKRVRISFRRFSQQGEKVDSLGYRYDGLGPNQDDWIDVMSYRIQKPGKMAHQLCYYSHTSQELLVDDTYDLLFQKEYEIEPFWGIMRCSVTRSTSYLNFFDHLCNLKGYDILLDILKQKDYPMDVACNMIVIFGFTSFLTPRMGLNRNLPSLLQAGIDYLKQNYKQFNAWRLQMFSIFIQNISKRIYSLSKKHKLINQIKRFLLVEYFKLNLQKNMIALKYLYELIKPVRPYQNEKEKEQFNKFLVESQIFYTVIQNNVHQQILSRSGDLIKYMLESNLIGWKEIEHIWSLIPHSDLRGRTTIQKLLAEISKSFSTEFTEKLIDILVNIKETELTIDKLNLIRTLKDREISTTHKQKLLYYLWQCLTVKSANIKQNVEQQIQNVYRGFISTLKQNDLKLSVIKAMIKRIRQISTVRNEMYLFRQFILTYPAKPDPNHIQEESDYPQTIRQVIVYLKNENIYEIIFKLLATAKNKDKISSILQFLQFLFDHDSDDISLILKLVYDILGPSDIFLSWAKHLTYRALNFFVQMYENIENMQKFQKITTDGLEAIKAILLDINVYKGNIKILKKKKVTQIIGPVQAPVQVSSQVESGVGTANQNYSTLPQKQETLTFVYILKSPFQCIGLAFLLQLLQYISSNKVYNDIIKLIIQFIVNLDDKIIDKSQLFMEQFLRKVIESMDSICKNKELTNNVKLQIDTYLNLIQELFSETQKNGLGNIIPHFTLMQSQILKLKVQNNITSSLINKKDPFIIEINQNATLWALKVLLAQTYELPPSKIDVIKYVTPIQDTNNGKSLSELFFFNEELIKIAKKDPKDVPKFDLLNDDNQTPTQRFSKILQKWFGDYKNQQNLLGLEELKKLANDNWKGSLMKQQDKIKEVLAKQDKDKKGGLSITQFKQYFAKTAYLENAKVWRLINLSGYKNNLRHKDEPQTIISQNSFPRKILSNKFVYQTIFNILSNDTFQPVHLNLYRFLGMLETDHQLCNYIKGNIKEFLEKQKCIYRLSYGLQALINQLESNLQLFGQFYEHNGVVQIAKKLSGYFFDQTSVYKLQQFLKIIVIPNLLKILSLYVYPLISSNKYIRFLKKVKINLLDTPEVIKKLQGQENYAPDQAEKRAILASKSNPFDFSQLYKLSYKILDNLIVNYDKEFLVRITNQIVKLYGFLALANPQFKPQDIFKGANSQSLNIRRSCHALIFFYMLKNKEKSFQLLQKLIQNVPQQTKTISNTYFDLITIIIQKTIEFEPESEGNDDFFKKLAVYLLESFFKAPNQYRGTILPNKTLNGLLSNLLIILQKKPKIGQFLSPYRQELIKTGLFAYQIKQKVQKLEVNQQLLLSYLQPQHFETYVKCKSQQNRKILMEIIYYLYKYSKEDHSLFFDKFILPVMNELVDTSKKNSLRTMHVGLTNFGSTCYLNSMMQVLNSTDIFRNAIMKVQVQSPLIQQLKSLFSFLFFSERVDYAPRNLLNAFIPQINPGLQQDTTEFLNFLFDQLEESLKKTPYKNILYELFQGNQVGQMICHSCGAKRQRIEHFFTYSVQIQGKYDLHSALQGMHAGELISDCLCESCGKRSDTTKRNVLSVVPNIFFVHLKRIVFDYNMFTNTKIHTRLYFPNQLNFQPFTKQGLQLRQQLGVQYLKTLKDNQQQMKKFQQLALHGHTKQYYQLKLKGVIVHSGTPDVGHYYAIIKKDNSWIKFDDSRVTSFGANMFEDECYGGSWVADEWGGSGSSKNAYVLVYQKVMKKDIQLQVNLDENTIEKKVVPFQQFTKITNTPDWYKKVWLDNHSLMLEQHLVSQNYTKQFLNFVCKMLELIESTSTIDLISQIFFKISALSGEVGNLPIIFEKNLHLIKNQHFKTYVLADSKRTFNLLFHQQPKIRQFASFYIERIIIHNYLNGNEQQRGEVKKFIQGYLYMLHNEAAKNWLRIDGYFKMFERIIRSACTIPQLLPLYQFFVGNDVLAFFIDFILQKASPLTLVQKKYSLGTKTNPVNFSAGLSIVFMFIQRSFGMIGTNYESPSINVNYLHHLSDNSILCLSCMTFYQKMIKENQNSQLISAIIQRLSIQNLAFSQSIARVLLKIVTENTQISDQLDTVLLCISKFLRINDQLWTRRAEAVLGVPTPFIYQKNILNSIDQEKYVYPSVLQNMFPIESLLNYAHINRLRVPLTILNILKTILEGTSVSQQSMDYLLKLPSPSYTHLRYVDWVRPYVNNVINHLNLSDKKKEEVINKITICNLYLDDLDKRRKDMFVFILGQIEERELIYRRKSQVADVEFSIYNVPVYVVDSLPNGNGNSTFDKYLHNSRLEKPVTENSNILRFFKQSGKPLAIKAQAVQQHEDKQLVGLFDQTPYNTSTTSQVQTENIIIQTAPKKQEQKLVTTMQVQETKAENNQTKIQEQIKEEVNIQGIRLSKDYLRCIQVANKSDSGKVTILNFNNPTQSNATLPTIVKFMVSKTKQQFYYTKQNPYKPWGDDSFTDYVFNYVQNPKLYFRLYQNPFAQINHETTRMNQTAQNKENIPENRTDMDIQEKKTDNHVPPNNQVDGMKECPVCTYLNPISFTHCEICESAL